MALKKLPLKYGGVFATAFCAWMLDLYGLGAAGHPSGDIMYRMLGEMREVMSDRFFIKADEYYHGGTRHPASQEHTITDASDHTDGDQCEHEVSAVPEPEAPGDVYSRLYRALHYRPVQHLSEFKRAEALPWFYVATRIDPHNINAYVTGGYWLAIPLQLPDEAISFLQEGLTHNPQAWQIYSQLGDIYFLVKKDYVRAGSEFLRADHYMQQAEDASPFDVRHVLTFLTATQERLGDYETALSYATRLVKLFPQDAGLKQRIMQLQRRRQSEDAL